MRGISVPIVVISELERDRYLEAGYNVPERGYDERALRAECQRASDGVKAALEAHWRHFSLGECGFSMDKDVSEMDFESEVEYEGDFFMNEEFGSSRLLCVEVSREETLTPRLIEAVHEALSTIEPDYSVDICDAFYVLKTKDGMLYPRFNIFVEKGRILVYSESTDLFDRLAIPIAPARKQGGREGRINVHYLYNTLTGAIDDAKIVLPGARQGVQRMRVRARPTERIEIPANIEPYTRQRFVTAGKEYDVHAIAINEDAIVFFQFVDDLGYPAWMPQLLFDVIETSLPSDWRCNSFPETQSGNLLALGPDFVVKDGKGDRRAY